MKKEALTVIAVVALTIFLVSGCVQENKQQPAEDASKAGESGKASPEPSVTATAVIQKSGDKFIVANPLDLSQIERISKFRSCIGHDYSGLNKNGERETLRSMKHYVEPLQKLRAGNTVKIFAPFDGKVSELLESPPGKQMFISANAAPSWNFIFFHISQLPEVRQGSSVKAGQLVGYAHQEIHNFDIGLKQFGFRGQVFDSPFLHMSAAVLDEYAARGVNPENIIIPKAERDAEPCPVEGTRNGDANFPGSRDQDYVKLE
ncbi:hypothetical protein HYU16_05230 [Candidatus Woesearchaeota archaeon]|nr:hypothetical protein [Candidatus Woesearchaeota archaeon]